MPGKHSYPAGHGGMKRNKHSMRDAAEKKAMKPPKRGQTNKPKRITTENEPGGPMTPGAKKKRK